MRYLIRITLLACLPAFPLKAGILDAASAGDHRALARAIERGSPLEERNDQGQTALLVAVWKNDIPTALALIAAGADVNAKDNMQDSPYLVAGAQGRTEILQAILKNGADLKSLNRFGGTALIPAAEKGHPETVALLIAAGVDLDHVNNLGWTALLEAVLLTDGGPTAQRIVTMLKNAGADISIPDRNGRTALDHARARGLTQMVEILSR